MDLNIEDYIVKYIFNRVENTYLFTNDDGKRSIKLENFMIQIPNLQREVKAFTKSILDQEISFYRFNNNVSIMKESNDLILSYDLIGETLDHLTLQREKDPNFDLNDFEVFIPILDIKIYDFFTSLNKFVTIKPKKINNHSFALGISHDIDRTGDSYKYRVITHFFQTLKQKRPLLIFKGLFGKNEEFNFEEIISLEKSFKARSTWFILSHYGLKLNADYTLQSKMYKKGIKLLSAGSEEIGLHIPFMELSVDGINNEFKKLPTEASRGVRMHHLRGDYKELMELFNLSEVTYDSTFGFNEVISYRFGTSIPFFPIMKDGESYKILTNILEIPLNIMDIQISDMDKFREEITLLFNILEKTGGVCVINWHNNRFNRTKYGPIWAESFKLLLEEASKRNAFIGPLNEIVKFFS